MSADYDKAYDLVAKIQKDHNVDGWDDDYSGGEAKSNLKQLDELDPETFKVVFNNLTAEEKEDLADDVDDDWDPRKDPKYKDLAKALEDNNLDDAMKFKNKQAESPAKFDKRGGGFLPGDGKKHFRNVSLYVPKGASNALYDMLVDTQDTMQSGMDSLGARNPKDAPDFSTELENHQLKKSDGWGRTIENYNAFHGRFTDHQEEFKKKNDKVNFTTKTTQKDLVACAKSFEDVVKDLNHALQRDLTPGDFTKQDKNKIVTQPAPGGPSNQEAEKTIYTRKTYKDNFQLTPTAEHQYFVKPIQTAVDKWNKIHDDTAMKFQKAGSDVDDDPPPKKPKPATPEPKTPTPKTPTPTTPTPTTPAAPANPAAATPTAEQAAADLTGGDDDWSDVLSDDLTDPEGEGTGTTDDTDATGGTDLLGLADSDTGEDGDGDGADDSTGSEQTGSEQAAAGTAAAPTTPAAAPTTPFANSGLGSMMNNPALSSFMNPAMNQNNPLSQLGQNSANTGSGLQGIPGLSGLNPGQTGADTTAQQANYTNPASGISANPALAATSPGAPTLPTHTMVDMKLPNSNATQQVTPAVAAAVNTELNNPNGCDAVRSYGNNLGNLTPFGDFPNLHTGDIARWDNHSAIVIGEGADKYLVVDGTMHQLPPLDSDEKIDMNNLPYADPKEYGSFQGFFRPDAVGDPSGSGQAQAPAVTAVSARSMTDARPMDKDTQRT